MSLYITSLNSGSNGNCYYIGNEREAILVDAGISCREIEKRIKRLGLGIQRIKAVFVSHEHSDHIKGICALVKKFQLPVYITGPTLRACGFTLDTHLTRSFEPDKPVMIGDLVVTAFQKCHDACDPYSFIVRHNDIQVGVFTDIGAPCQNLVKYFRGCHAAFLEANFDETMLKEGNYPYHLKKRISGGNGHLSNRQALELFKTHKPAFMSHLLLAHLSENNNCPIMVRKLFEDNAGAVKITVASRFEETEVFHIHGARKTMSRSPVAAAQLAFSFI